MVCAALAVVGCTEVVELETPQATPVPVRGPAGEPPRRPVERAPDSPLPVPVVVDPTGLPAKTRDGWLRGERAERNPAEEARLTLAGELARYPTAFVERVGLRRVVLVGSLTFEGIPTSAYSAVELGTIYVDVSLAGDPRLLRETIHHEVFHLVDFADDGRLDADPAWEALNPAGFRYSDDAARYQSDFEAARAQTGVSGFLNRYATSSPTEDKAVVYAALVTDRDTTLERAGRDAILGRKVARVRDMLEAVRPRGSRLTLP